MDFRFSKRFNDLTPSMIREVRVKAAGPGMIDFSVGRPAKEVFPEERIRSLSDKILAENMYEILQYASKTADDDLVIELKKFFNSIENIVTDDDDIMVTSGSGEGLELASKVFCDEGDSIIVEDPSFVGALNGFKSNGAKLIGVPLESDGLDLDLLEKAMQTKPTPKLLYIIPTFQNPKCFTTPLEKRKAIYELCLKYGVMILEDNPYGNLRFKGKAVPSFKALDTEGIVIYLASLSKIISPGVRVGTVVARKEVVNKFSTMKGTRGGAVTNWSQHLIKKFLQTTDMEDHIARVTEIYRIKSALMLEKMREHFHPDIRIQEPDGGMFIWFDLPEYVSVDEFFDKAVAKHIAIVPGNGFATDYESQGFRLSFTTATMDEIVTGIKTLGEISYECCN